LLSDDKVLLFEFEASPQCHHREPPNQVYHRNERQFRKPNTSKFFVQCTGCFSRVEFCFGSSFKINYPT